MPSIRPPVEVVIQDSTREWQCDESESRNILRGDGFFGLDMGLSKRWKMPYWDQHSLQFRWEVFNVPNATRFNTTSLSLALDQGTSFGHYTQLLTNPRVMQFALRYEF